MAAMSKQIDSRETRPSRYSCRSKPSNVTCRPVGAIPGGSIRPVWVAEPVHVPVAETFGLDQVHDAYERFAAGGKLGKIVLLMAAG